MDTTCWKMYNRNTTRGHVCLIAAPTKEAAELFALEHYGRVLEADLVRLPLADNLTPIWDLFYRGGSKCGGCDAETKEEVERVAREELGKFIDADARRERVDAPDTKYRNPHNGRG